MNILGFLVEESIKGLFFAYMYGLFFGFIIGFFRFAVFTVIERRYG